MSSELAFNSKIDLWLLIVILTAVAACLWGIGAIWDANSVVFWPVAFILALGGIMLPIWILVSLRYYLSDEVLRVRCGPRQWKIAIRNITSVSPTNEAKTSPALSFDRLLIEYDTGRVLISPEPRAEFLRQLEHRRKRAA